MINVDYSGKEIKIQTKLVSKFYNCPLRLVISNHVTNQEIWSCELNDNTWASFPNNEMHDVNIYDKNGHIYKRDWDVLLDGDILYRSLYLYCKNLLSYNIKPQGLAIGTHDGEFGEWVPCILDHITDATLVEASSPQFSKLSKNYKDFPNVKLINELITTDGQSVEFFEGGRGYTNSVVESVIKSWETEEIHSSLRSSKSINKIIETECNGKLDWLHTDVEGYDSKLIMSIKEEYLPNLIIFENNNFDQDTRNTLNTYLELKGYTLYEETVSTLALK